MSTADSPFATTFIASRFFTPASRTSIDWIVLHDVEARESAETAENVASWLHGPAANHVSAHYYVDQDSAEQGVREASLAWAAGHTGNQRGIHIELAGFASHDAATWLADPVLGVAAPLVACIARRWSVPVVWLTVEDVLAGRHGVCSHWTISRAFHESDHHDLGEAFESEVAEQFVEMCRGALEA